MKNKILKTCLITALLLSSLTFNVILVQGDFPGTGKFLTINFYDASDSDCYVTATKSSGQVFTFLANDTETYSQKVGAGTVFLEAIEDEDQGWTFSRFVSDGDLITIDDNSALYQTEKYGEVDAIFNRLSYTIVASVTAGEGSISVDGIDYGTEETFSVNYGESITFEFNPAEGYYISRVVTDSGEIESPYVLGPITSNGWINVEFELITFDIEVFVVDGFGEIWFEGVPVADENNDINYPAIVTIDYGSTPLFEFEPDPMNHLSAVLVDRTSYVDLVLTDFTQTYQFTTPIKEEGHSLAVTFSPDGLAVNPNGSDVTVFLSNAASLTFYDVGQGTAYGEEIFVLAPGDLVAWEITVEAILGDQVIVALKYDPPPGTNENNLRLYRLDVEDYGLYLKCDFNDDGIVNGQDVKIIANIVKLPKFLPENPGYYDLNGDEIIDQNDVHIVNSMKNVESVDITLYVNTDNNIIYGITDHFSVFKCR